MKVYVYPGHIFKIVDQQVACIKRGRHWGLGVGELSLNEIMSCVQKIMQPVELKISANKCYYFIKNNVYHFPNVTSIIQDVAVDEGDWDNCSHDSMKVWNYTIGEYQHHPSHQLSICCYIFTLILLTSNFLYSVNI